MSPPAALSINSLPIAVLEALVGDVLDGPFAWLRISASSTKFVSISGLVLASVTTSSIASTFLEYVTFSMSSNNSGLTCASGWRPTFSKSKSVLEYLMSSQTSPLLAPIRLARSVYLIISSWFLANCTRSTPSRLLNSINSEYAFRSSSSRWFLIYLSKGSVGSTPIPRLFLTLANFCAALSWLSISLRTCLFSSLVPASLPIWTASSSDLPDFLALSKAALAALGACLKNALTYQPMWLRPPPAATVFNFASHTLSLSSTANLLTIGGTNQGVYWFAKLIILPPSEDWEINSAAPPSPKTRPALLINCKGLLLAINFEPDLNTPRFVKPALVRVALPIPPTPPVSLTKSPNSIRPLAIFPILVLFSGS